MGDMKLLRAENLHNTKTSMSVVDVMRWFAPLSVPRSAPLSTDTKINLKREVSNMLNANTQDKAALHMLLQAQTAH